MQKLSSNFSQFTYFHAFNKSIQGYGIFRSNKLKERFKKTLIYYKQPTGLNLSNLLQKKPEFEFKNLLARNSNDLLKIVAWCIMPTHYHLLIKCKNVEELSEYIRLIQDSYTRYYNTKFGRKGPLWQSRFKKVMIKTNNEVLHVTRYIHINPTTAGLVEKPEDWEYSSYRDYIYNSQTLKNLKEISIRKPLRYKQFVDEQIKYQKMLQIIKKYKI